MNGVGNCPVSLLKNMKVEVLTKNIYFDGSFHYKGDVVEITKESKTIIDELDKKNGREPRLKAVVMKKKTTTAKKKPVAKKKAKK